MSDQEHHRVLLWDQHGKPVRYKNDSADESKNSGSGQFPTPNMPPAPSHDGNPDDKRGRGFEVAKLVLECVAIVIAIFGGVIYYRQLNAAKRQADAAERQLSQMQTENILDKRAWVFGVHSEIQPGAGSNTMVEKVIIKNFGKTPARNVDSYISGTWGDGSKGWMDSVSNFLSKKDVFLNLTSVTIVQDDSHHVQTDDIPNSVLDGVKSGKTVIIFYGGIQYDDVFNVHHWSQFCFRLSSNLDLATPMKFHNSSDDAENDNH
jgi:hypothetical protein